MFRCYRNLETSEQRKAREDAANQAAIDKERAAAGGRGLYGGAPLSVAQFGAGSAALRTEFGNTTVDAACGPIAVEALARLGGNPQAFRDILAWARANGYWNPNDGITNAGFGPLAAHFGVQTNVTGDQRAAIQAIAAGHPVVINTPIHYALAQGYDPASGLFDLGYTGETVFNHRYMTLGQLETYGGGFNNFYIANGLDLFAAGGATPPTATSRETANVSIPTLGVNFQH